jgi:hypothetical protein
MLSSLLKTLGLQFGPCAAARFIVSPGVRAQKNDRVVTQGDVWKQCKTIGSLSSLRQSCDARFKRNSPNRSEKTTETTLFDGVFFACFPTYRCVLFWMRHSVDCGNTLVFKEQDHWIPKRPQGFGHSIAYYVRLGSLAISLPSILRRKQEFVLSS